MKDMYRTVKRPLITEKANLQRENLNQYSFVVDEGANKVEIKEAVERIFKVKVAQVRIQNVPGKPKRHRHHRFQRAGWKKALVTLKEGSIEIFEGA